MDVIDYLNNFTQKRKNELLRDDLDEMQKEFLDKKEKCHVKIKKEKIEDNNNNKSTEKIESKIQKIKGKKKTRDVISLNIPLNLGNINIPKQKESLFGLNFEKEEKNFDINKIDNKTGLPGKIKLIIKLVCLEHLN